MIVYQALEALFVASQINRRWKQLSQLQQYISIWCKKWDRVLKLDIANPDLLEQQGRSHHLFSPSKQIEPSQVSSQSETNQCPFSLLLSTRQRSRPTHLHCSLHSDFCTLGISSKSLQLLSFIGKNQWKFIGSF